MAEELRFRVFSKKDCVQCDGTYRAMKKHGFEYELVNLEESPDALNYVQSLGYQQAPVVVMEDANGEETHWSGFRPDILKRLARNQG